MTQIKAGVLLKFSPKIRLGMLRYKRYAYKKKCMHERQWSSKVVSPQIRKKVLS